MTESHADHPPRTVRWTWILLIVPGVIWGASFLFIAEGLEAMGPNGVTFTRILVGFVTLALFSGSRRPISAKTGSAPPASACSGWPFR